MKQAMLDEFHTSGDGGRINESGIEALHANGLGGDVLLAMVSADMAATLSEADREKMAMVFSKTAAYRATS